MMNQFDEKYMFINIGDRERSKYVFEHFYYNNKLRGDFVLLHIYRVSIIPGRLLI